MPILNFDDFATFMGSAPKNGAILGIDNGEKNIGIAVSDLTRLIASPQPAVKKQKFTETAASIFKIFDAKECIAIVIGNPINLNGTSGPSAQAARAFARNLAALRDVPIMMADERLSTSAVQRQMIDADVSRKNRAQKVDSAAAAFVLQGVLDRLRP